MKKSSRTPTGGRRRQQGSSSSSSVFCLVVLIVLLALLVVTVQFHFVSLDHGTVVLKLPSSFLPSSSLRRQTSVDIDAPREALPPERPPSFATDASPRITTITPGSTKTAATAAAAETLGAGAGAAATLSRTGGRRRIAYAITITKDGFFQDGAAVLAYSIIKHSQNKDYDVSLVAFVHPSVVTSRPVLSRIGFHVIEAPTPVNVSAITFKFLREKINKNGCCGASELIKLNSYRLEQYDKVIHLDADTCLLNSIDEIINRNFSLIYTTDPNMATHNGEDRMPSQGGLLVFKPDTQDYRNIINIVMTTDFNMGGGWNGSKIGWFWGGMTVQGVLPYYYNVGTLTPKGRRQIVDRCIYNTMADSDECQKTPLSLIKTAHFTVCQKPWTCYQSYVNTLCRKLHEAWFQLRTEAEQFYSLAVTPDACKVNGRNRYAYMTLDQATLPTDPRYSFLIPDDSPSILKPLQVSRFLTEDYEKFSGGKGNVPDTPEEVEEKRLRKEKREQWEAKKKEKEREKERQRLRKAAV